MIIKLTKDKKIVNDMFEQEISWGVVAGKTEQNSKSLIHASGNEWINESINNRIAMSLQSNNKLLVLT